MANFRLMKQFINIFDTQQLNDLHDILVDDFYFRSPKIEIFGKANYIEYAKDSGVVFTTDLIKLSRLEDDLYVHEYIVTMFDSQIKLNDQVHVVEHVKIRDGLIASSIIDYEIDGFSDSAKELLTNTVKNHGNLVKN